MHTFFFNFMYGPGFVLTIERHAPKRKKNKNSSLSKTKLKICQV